MGVYIKGMEMPTSCATCKLFGEYGCPLIGTVTYALTRGKRHKDCPLIPVPPHGDLVDRDALEQDAQKRLLMCNKNDNHFQRPYEVIRAIALAPTIIPASKEET